MGSAGGGSFGGAGGATTGSMGVTDLARGALAGPSVSLESGDEGDGGDGGSDRSSSVSAGTASFATFVRDDVVPSVLTTATVVDSGGTGSSTAVPELAIDALVGESATSRSVRPEGILRGGTFGEGELRDK